MHGKAHNTKQRRQQATCWALALALLVTSVSPGCRTCQIPRIDPTGESLFAPGTTTFEPQLGALPTPQPAFITPPAPPACGPGQTGPCKKQHIKLNCDKLCDGIKRELTCAGDEGQLMVTPATVIAPVGSEVVILAGLCGPDRTFVARQPIEFALSQESVGNFVDVGDDGECVVTRLYRSQPKKTTGSYVVGVSSASAQTITRGTPQPNDDIQLGKGQTWLSVTSPSEGTSYVSVLAPNANNWDQRRQTAVVHWVDAQWQFPAPAIVPAGRPHRLTTIVRRGGGTVPASGWTVRYEVTAGEPAGFAPNGQKSVDVPVDAQGAATVDIQQLANNAGTSTVSVQVMRPGYLGGAGPMVVGQGWTAITWSAPGLAVNVVGPQTVAAGLEATYRIDVSNPGDIASRDVVVAAELPPSLEFSGSNPPPQQFGNRLEWRLGELPPKATRSIDVKAAAVRGGDIRFRVQASSADGVQTEGSFASQVTQQSLSLALSGPQTAFVGETATFRIEVANLGDQPLTNVRLRANFPAGLEQDKGLRSPVEWQFGNLQPRERAEPRGISFVVRSPGQLCLTMEATAEGSELTSAQACVAASVKQVSALQVVKAGPAEVRVGENAEYTIEVTNTGNTPITNIRIVDQYPASMLPTAATAGRTLEEGAVVWLIPELGPNVLVRRKVACQALKADERAVNVVEVTADGGLRQGDQAITRVVGGETFSRRIPADDARAEKAESGNVNADGQLRLSIREGVESGKVGQELTYRIEIHNDRQVSDREVRLRITLPEGLSYVGFKGRYAGKPQEPDNRVIDITPIAEMRPGERIDGLEMTVKATAAGKLRVGLEATSQRSPNGITTEEQTTIFP